MSVLPAVGVRRANLEYLRNARKRPQPEQEQEAGKARVREAEYNSSTSITKDRKAVKMEE